MAYDIDAIEGIGPSYKSKLAQANIKTTEELLNLCCTPKGRNDVSAKTGLSAATLLKWANMADLMRIRGIGPEFAELLEAAGVDTVKELRNRNADNLAQAMKAANDEKKLARVSPPAATISTWVAEAKTTEPKISH